MQKISIIVPIYEEQKTIANFIAKLKEAILPLTCISECILVDDGSKDSTMEILKTSGLKILAHNINLGYGAAIKTGANEAQNDVICIIDADNQFDPSDIQKLLPFINQYDMVVGSRIKDAAKDMPLHQRIAKFLISSLLNAAFKQEITDINSGFRIIKKDLVKKYSPMLPDGFSLTASITLVMLLNGNKIKYVPVNYYKREGKSKVRVFSYTLNFLKSYLRIIYLHLMRKVVSK